MKQKSKKEDLSIIFLRYLKYGDTLMRIYKDLDAIIEFTSNNVVKESLELIQEYIKGVINEDEEM